MASSVVDKSRMAPAWKLFEEGDKLAARRVAEEVLKSNPSDQERLEATDLLGRAKAPVFAWIMAGVVVVVAIILTLFARSYLD